MDELEIRTNVKFGQRPNNDSSVGFFRHIVNSPFACSRIAGDELNLRPGSSICGLRRMQQLGGRKIYFPKNKISYNVSLRSVV